ncbi:MAG: copper resistance system multicopper oxidase [Alphaproteobacteria bacterium]|nr:copper resistance system multicopper oxidase [Alphaproteobacteria bacterium]
MSDPVIARSFFWNRRRFVQGLAAGGAALSWPRSVRAEANLGGMPLLEGNTFNLDIAPLAVNITGRRRTATAVNGSLPGPILRFREGDVVTLNVTNKLSAPTSIHWHGVLLPNAMDGVPGLTFRGIMPGETFTYRFPVKQSGTYWYHSHSGMQEQTGLYGPLILEPRTKESYVYDREYVVMLSDWTDDNPTTIMSNLKQQSDYYNYHQRTLGTFVADAKRDGLGATLKDRLDWGAMRMSPTDIMDVTGATYTFLVNGHPPAANWTALFHPGERVRLRFINGSSMTTFDVRIPELNLIVVQADGSDVVPVMVDEFRIGVAETYDVIVQPDNDAYTIFAQAEDCSGYARATLAPRPGMIGAVPPLDPRPMKTMADMGMGNMAGMNANSSGGGATMAGMSQSPAPSSGNSTSAMDSVSNMDMSGMSSMGSTTQGNMPGMGQTTMPAAARIPTVNASGVDPATLAGNPNVDNVAMMPQSRLAEAGDGLDGNGRRNLTYADLAASEPAEDAALPTREIEFHLTGNMERFTWGFDGKAFSEAPPVHVKLGECVRFVLINDTMMEHPIHLHGFLFALENGQGNQLPRKHTINVKPNEKVGFVFVADTPGYWAFHCHLLYHMEMGMFRTVVVS